MNKRCWPVYNLLGQGNTLDFVTISVVLYKNGGCKINGKGRNILNLNQLSTTQIQLDLHQKPLQKIHNCSLRLVFMKFTSLVSYLTLHN